MMSTEQARNKQARNEQARNEQARNEQARNERGQLIGDLQSLVNAIHLGQSRGAYKLEESESLSKNVRNLKLLIKTETAKQ